MTPKQAAENLGKPAKFRGHEYTLTALIKRFNEGKIKWQVELSWYSSNGYRSTIIADPREIMEVRDG